MGYKEEIFSRLERTGFENYEDVLNWLLKDSKGNQIRNETPAMEKLAIDLLKIKEEKEYAQTQIRQIREIPPEKRTIVPAHLVGGKVVRTHVYVKWTKPQLKYLRKNYNSAEIKDIANHLNRSEASVRAKYYRTFKRQLKREKRRKEKSYRS